MVVKNKTRQTFIARNGKLASSLIDSTFGLLIKSNPRSLLFKTRFGIHTFFLTNSIDVLILDDEHVVRVVKEGLEPNRVYFWNPIYSLVLELPKGSIDKSKTKIGDVLKLQG